MTNVAPKPDLTLQDLYEELGRIMSQMPDENDFRRMANRQQLESQRMAQRHKDEQDAHNKKQAQAVNKIAELKRIIQKVIAGENPLVAYLATRGTTNG